MCGVYVKRPKELSGYFEREPEPSDREVVNFT